LLFHDRLRLRRTRKEVKHLPEIPLPTDPPSPARPRRRADVVLHDLGLESMLYDPVADTVIRLNVTARRIWDLCDGTRSPDEIAAALALEFDVPEGASPGGYVSDALERFGGAGVLAAPGPGAP
jgi:hypothetical protein